MPKIRLESGWFWKQVILDTHLRAGTDGVFLLPTEPNMLDDC